MATRRQVLGAAAATMGTAVVGGVLGAPPAHAAYATSIDPSKDYGGWDGWGASLAWWANVFGMDNTLADLFYTRNTVSYQGRNLPGLGMNVVRYNLGASSWQPAGNPPVYINEAPTIPRYKAIEGYRLNWDSPNPTSNSWNWWVDSNQRNMMWKARDRGANLFELFSNSPMWWMCKNHCPSGDNNGGDNLQSWNYQQHAVYLAAVAKYAHDNWGVNFISVEPFNEPSAPWWTPSNPNPQEGCHISANVPNVIQQQVVNYLRTELNNRGLNWMAISASDENTYDQATATWANFGLNAARTNVGRVNTHGYQYADQGSARTGLYNSVHGYGMPLWQSEYGEGWEHGLYLAYNLSLDLRYLHPTAWCYWQPVDGKDGNGSWGLLKATYDNNHTTKGGQLGDPHPTAGTDPFVANKYFVLAQYTRHVRPGMRIIDSGDQATVAAYDRAAHRLVLATVRGNSQQRITYDLSRFGSVGGAAGGTVRRWITDAKPDNVLGRQYVRGTDVVLNGKGLSVDFDPYVIQTFEIDNVTP